MGFSYLKNVVSPAGSVHLKIKYEICLYNMILICFSNATYLIQFDQTLLLISPVKFGEIVFFLKPSVYVLPSLVTQNNLFTKRVVGLFSSKMDDAVVAKELAISDSEHSDAEVSYTDNGTFNLSRGQTPLTEGSEGEGWSG